MTAINKFVSEADACDHHIYLQVPTLVNGTSYTLQTPHGEKTFVFDERTTFCESIKSNQSGYSALSKMRYASAQLLACLSGEFFATNAARANALAARIAAVAGQRLMFPVEANLLFLKLPAEEAASLRARGFEFYDWGPPRTGGTRFAVSWDQPESDVDALCGALSAWN